MPLSELTFVHTNTPIPTKAVRSTGREGGRASEQGREGGRKGGQKEVRLGEKGEKAKVGETLM